MQVEIRKNRPNKKAKRPNFHKGSQSHSPSQTNGGAKIQINSVIAIPKLQKLAQKYLGITDPHGFLTDLRVALGIPDSQGASKYGVVSIPKEDGSILQASLRVTNHQANANTYIEANSNYNYNLSIVVRRKPRQNTFIANDNVTLDEFVYYGTMMRKVKNPLTQIVDGIIKFLQIGEYKDSTGIAYKNHSPQPNYDTYTACRDAAQQYNNRDNGWGNATQAEINWWKNKNIGENKEIKHYTNMNKKLIRLTESDLHKIVKESVNRIINEMGDTNRVKEREQKAAEYVKGADRLYGYKFGIEDVRVAFLSGAEWADEHPSEENIQTTETI